MRTKTLVGIACGLPLLGCATPVTVTPDPSPESVQAAQRTLSQHDPRQAERIVKKGLTPALEVTNRVGEKVVREAGHLCYEVFSSGCHEAMSAIQVRVYDADEVLNAYAAKDGEIAVYSGILQLTASDDEVAAILAHEIAHVLYGHNQAIQRNKWLGRAVGALGAAAVIQGTKGDSQGSGGAGLRVMRSGTKLGGWIGQRVHSPAMELEADRFAVFVVARAGYDPRKAVEILPRLAHIKREGRMSKEDFRRRFRTHPPDSVRIAHWHETIAAWEDGERAPRLISDQPRRAVPSKRTERGLRNCWRPAEIRNQGWDVPWLERTAEAGSAEAQNTLGVILSDGVVAERDEPRAAQLFEQAAEQGHAKAQANLAEAYLHGYGVPKDTDKGRTWLRKAKTNGSPITMAWVGMVMLEGLGETPDETSRAIVAEFGRNEAEGLEWMKRAAKGGVAFAQWMMGVGYETGRWGVKVDEEQARYWYELAAEGGEERAVEALKAMEAASAPETFMEELKAAADRGEPEALVPAALVYTEEGEGRKAFELLQKAAARGDAEGQRLLGGAYYNGIGVEPNDEGGRFWYKEAARNGDRLARRHLGVLYAMGEEVPKDLKKSVYHFKIAAWQGDPYSMTMVGDAYWKGEGARKHPGWGIAWYQAAVQSGYRRKEHLMEDIVEPFRRVVPAETVRWVDEKTAGILERVVGGGADRATLDGEREKG